MVDGNLNRPKSNLALNPMATHFEANIKKVDRPMSKEKCFNANQKA
jgi:hypothetical protein